MIAMYSRVRASGLPNGTPCQPSTTCGPDGPMPHKKRLPESACKVIAVIAAQAGVRAGICMIAGAGLDPLGLRQHPGDRRHRVGAIGLAAPHRIVTEPFGLQHEIHVDPGGGRHPQGHGQFHRTFSAARATRSTARSQSSSARSAGSTSTCPTPASL